MLRFFDAFTGLLHRLAFGLLPKTLISFLFVGATGVLVHMLVLQALLHTLTTNFRIANACAMLCAASSNYLLNNKATFRMRALSGKLKFSGYFIYLAITSLGMAASLLVSGWVFDRIHRAMPAALCGILVGALWNYFMSYQFVWKLLDRARA